MSPFDLYKYLFYRLYIWCLNTWGEKEFPQFSAMFGASFMICLNLFLIPVVLLFFGYDFFAAGPIPKGTILTLGFGILIICYFNFVHNRRFESIAHSYNNESKTTKTKNLIFLWVYTVVSFLLPIGLLVLYRKMVS